MLDPLRKNGVTDWLYRPDGQFQKELERMQLFSRAHAPRSAEYRINPHFLRQDGFLDLVHSGYVGAYAQATSALTALIQQLLRTIAPSWRWSNPRSG